MGLDPKNRAVIRQSAADEELRLKVLGEDTSKLKGTTLEIEGK